MRLSIIDSNYAKGEHKGMAATWLEWEVVRHGEHQLVAASDADYLLCTVSSQQGVIDLRRAIKRANNKTAKVIVGGGGTWAPAIFDGLADVCCVGEGQNLIKTFLEHGYDAVLNLPESWIPGDSKIVAPSEKFPWDVPPINHPDGTVRLFGSRGCKYKCLFCQTGWEQSYRVNPDPKKLSKMANALELKGHKIAIVTNDGSEENVEIKGQQQFLSMRLAGMIRLMNKRLIDRKYTKSVRIGVEGVSERLRSAVGKPVKNSDLLTVTQSLASRGVGVRWFFIAGLPNETERDWLELRELVRGLKQMPKGCVMLNFHAFIPQPATPLCVLPVKDCYWEWFEEFRRWFFHGPGFTRRAQIVAPAQYRGRMSRAIESMSATEQEIRRGWWEHDNVNWRVKYPAPPDVLRRVAKAYDNKTKVQTND